MYDYNYIYTYIYSYKRYVQHLDNIEYITKIHLQQAKTIFHPLQVLRYNRPSLFTEFKRCLL